MLAALSGERTPVKVQVHVCEVCYIHEGSTKPSGNLWRCLLGCQGSIHGLLSLRPAPDCASYG